ncbi:class I SAM-dependent methyltransferase [Ottowia pentelensis]|uniref:Class I SAM-dependent methyltransferase n=1 Tax=Ottowia pentelensis TaxID=511108 RepID=A0ABV6PUJ5_9BURK
MSDLHDWFQTPAGQVVLAWERARLDEALADVFGYHALQLGLAELDAMAANRMPHRWLANVTPPLPEAAVPRTALVTDSTALPFGEASLDLVVLPHTLEFSADPHACLREVQRVLVPEGRVAITGFNPASLWGLRQYRAHWLGGRLFLPDVGEFIGPRRLRDWLQLLELELESAEFGCYQPAVRGARTLARFGWLERLGQRWWPILGATYCIVAVKRVRGPLLIGQSWRKAAAPVGQPASIAGRATPAGHHKESHFGSR